MKIYPKRPLTTREGEEMKEGTQVVLTRMLLATILDMPAQGKKFTGDEKMKRFKLQMKMYNPELDYVELEAGDVALLKEVLDDSPIVTPHLYGQIMQQMEE